jgi:hypothetical protein
MTPSSGAARSRRSGCGTSRPPPTPPTATRATGELGVVIASTGPDTTNTMTGLFEAIASGHPALLDVDLLALSPLRMPA